jgi:signal transduction histidine kinase
MEINIESYDATTLIVQMLSEHILLMKESGYEVNDIIEVEELFGYEVSTDAQKLIRIFDNVFSNIYKYADKTKPVSILCKRIDNKIYLSFSNVISKDKSKVESNGIGLKTCKKLGEYICADFKTVKNANIFTVEVTLDANKT